MWDGVSMDVGISVFIFILVEISSRDPHPGKDLERQLKKLWILI